MTAGRPTRRASLPASAASSSRRPSSSSAGAVCSTGGRISHGTCLASNGSPPDTPRPLSSPADGAPAIWDYLPYGPFESQEAFTGWLEGRAATDDPLFYALVDHKGGVAQGMASYLRMDLANGVIEIGHIWFAPVMQRTRQATEAIFVLARHAFDDLGYRRLEWKCDSRNATSRRAAERFGFVYEGVFRRHMVVKGRNRDTAWYALTDGDWPLRRRSD